MHTPTPWLPASSSLFRIQELFSLSNKHLGCWDPVLPVRLYWRSIFHLFLASLLLIRLLRWAVARSSWLRRLSSQVSWSRPLKHSTAIHFCHLYTSTTWMLDKLSVSASPNHCWLSAHCVMSHAWGPGVAACYNQGVFMSEPIKEMSLSCRSPRLKRQVAALESNY